jgi:hypothetical protein
MSYLVEPDLTDQQIAWIDEQIAEAGLHRALRPS